MKLSHGFYVATIASLALLLSTAIYAQEKKPLTLGTSTVGGTYFVYGGVVATLLNKSIPTINVSTQQTQGPNQNVILMEAKRIELGLTTMGVAKQAWDGTGSWTAGRKYRNMRAVFPMFASVFNCISRKGSGVTTMADLNGKSVNVGPKAGTSGTYSPLVFDALGLKVNVRNSGASDGVGQLADGLVDAFCFAAGLPITSISEFESQHPTQFIEFTDEQIKKVMQKYPELSPAVVPKGLYPSLDKDWKSLGQWSFFIVHKDLDQNLVYEITKTVLENHSAMVQGHAAAKHTVIKNVDKNGFLPFHPGALRYYKEKGVNIPSDLSS
jgi:TRAP transporter TAXI family solute receptor